MDLIFIARIVFYYQISIVECTHIVETITPFLCYSFVHKYMFISSYIIVHSSLTSKFIYTICIIYGFGAKTKLKNYEKKIKNLRILGSSNWNKSTCLCFLIELCTYSFCAKTTFVSFFTNIHTHLCFEFI